MSLTLQLSSSFHLRSLKPLSSGSKIPTLFDNHSLTVTSGPSDDDAISVNGVKINGSPIYDDGSLVILGIGEFLDPDFEVSPKIPGTGGKHGCSFEAGRGFYSFKEATGVLRSKAFSVIASFLDLQLVGSKDRPALTIFAPVDEVMKGFVGNVDEYSSIFLRHVVPCKMPWKDLVNFNDGMVLDTYSEGFGIRISRSGDIFMLNEVPVSFPDMYQSDWLVVHGLRGILEGPNRPEEVGSASSEMGNNRETSILDDVEL
ncbi:hypothetical protein GH714_041158 [Hevea brasiliensis]|uniref:FAS1 domain-containing protein n=1 Tax=Hevea brasiliensis TaxID=3981 RepID=A0A6A6MVE9_HEVBR|nr:hypothetical protein GH714_041158 [Hevea brasiliensis]